MSSAGARVAGRPRRAGRVGDRAGLGDSRLTHEQPSGADDAHEPVWDASVIPLPPQSAGFRGIEHECVASPQGRSSLRMA